MKLAISAQGFPEKSKYLRFYVNVDLQVTQIPLRLVILLMDTDF